MSRYSRLLQFALQHHFFNMACKLLLRGLSDTGFKIRALAVQGQARYLSVTEAPHNIESIRLSREEIFVIFETPEWGLNP